VGSPSSPIRSDEDPYHRLTPLPAFYLIAFDTLRSVFKPAELDELFATMVERQIRIRRDIEYYLEGWVAPDVMEVGEGNEGNDEGDQEVEAVLTERRRLMPI